MEEDKGEAFVPMRAQCVNEMDRQNEITGEEKIKQSEESESRGSEVEGSECSARQRLL